LIVCEGGKTEPDYFVSLGSKLELIGRRKHVEVQVVGKECGSDPISVVNFAIRLRKERNENASRSPITREFDSVYCVIDRDRHETLDDAIQKAKDSNVEVILSNPCFEYWLLLHFVKYAKPFLLHRDVEKVLKKKYPKYSKNKVQGQFFETLYGKIDSAVVNAKAVIREKHWGENLCDCNPSTHVHLLVEYLRGMAQKPY